MGLREGTDNFLLQTGRPGYNPHVREERTSANLRRAPQEALESASPNFFAPKPLESPKTAKEKFGKIWLRGYGLIDKKGIFQHENLVDRHFLAQSKDFPNFCRRSTYGAPIPHPSRLRRDPFFRNGRWRWSDSGAVDPIVPLEQALRPERSHP